MHIKGHVITIFWQDFWKQIDEWLDNGEQLIVGGDWNRDVTKSQFLQEFKNRKLVPAISTKHDTNLP